MRRDELMVLHARLEDVRRREEHEPPESLPTLADELEECLDEIGRLRDVLQQIESYHGSWCPDWMNNLRMRCLARDALREAK